MCEGAHRMRHHRVYVSLPRAFVGMALALVFAWYGFTTTPLSYVLPVQMQPAYMRPRPQVRLSQPTQWSKEHYPDYVRVVSGAYIDSDVPAGAVVYSPLDAYGRAVKVEGCVTYDMMQHGSKRQREELPNPSGWGYNKKVAIELPQGRVYHGWFWNRSHMLAKSLGGEEKLENLVCGTRMQNVGAHDDKGGMDYCEAKARLWLKSHPDGYMYYIVTALYRADELVPRSVVVDMLSSDHTINEEVEVYNTALGYEINYNDGTFKQKSE